MTQKDVCIGNCSGSQQESPTIVSAVEGAQPSQPKGRRAIEARLMICGCPVPYEYASCTRTCYNLSVRLRTVLVSVQQYRSSSSRLAQIDG